MREEYHVPHCLRLFEKHSIRGIIGLINVLIAELAQKSRKTGPIIGRNLQTGQNATEIGAVVAIVEKADIPC